MYKGWKAKEIDITYPVKYGVKGTKNMRMLRKYVLMGLIFKKVAIFAGDDR